MIFKSKKMSSRDKTGLVVLVLAALFLIFILVVLANYNLNFQLINPKGTVALQQSHLMMFSTVVLLSIAIPTLFLLYFFAWKYRASNKKAKHDPNRRLSKFSVLNLWIIPSIVVVVLAAVVLPDTRRLDPRRAIAAGVKPITIQVIAMRWKWLFIYPQQNVAAVNFVQIPVNTPVQFELTADEAPMSSFWIPQLGGQLYAMTGHDNRLNLMADTLGDYTGRSAEINGVGFAGMKFIARASSKSEFDQWAQGLQQSAKALDSAEYNRLLVPSVDNPAALYSLANPDLYLAVLLKYSGSHHHTEL